VAAAASLWRAGGREVEGLPTLAVLPFAGSEAASDVLGSSLAHELTRELSVVPCGPLQVIGQSSAARAGSGGARPLAVGRRLGASHLVVGSVADDGASLSLSVAVLRVSDGTELWKERVSTSWEELLTTQSVLAGEIATRVGDVVGTCPRPEAPEVEATAMEGYLRARYLASRGRWDGALQLLREVVAAAPQFAAAHVALGEALVASSELPERAIEARRSAVTALRLSPNDPQAHLLRARVALGFEWDWRRAERHLERAAELAPGDPSVHIARALYLSSLGRHQEALESAEIAKRLDPLSTAVQGDLAMLYFWAGDWVGVRREAERLLELEPETGIASSLRLEALLRQQEWELARQLALSVYGEDTALLAAAGRDLSRRLLAIQEERWKDASPGPTREMTLASLAAEQERAPDAVRHLREAVELRSSYVPFLPTDPHFSTLTSRRDFQDLLASVGHPLAKSEPDQPFARAREP
jgi:TolB-like protein/tetratricopeptide (TPR) repeat protein